MRLASASATRRAMLEAAGLKVSVHPARVDEDAMRASMQAEGARPRDIADALAALKAQKAGQRDPQALTLGADQVLDFQGRCHGKPETPEEAVETLTRMSGKPHVLYSAAAVWQDGAVIWRHVGQARMQMRVLSEGYIRGYVERNWEDIRHSAGGYQIEGEGIRLFTSIGTDYHAILGLPMVPLLNWMVLRGEIEA
nr:Maf family protein [Frigidibacter sp. ROC022]